MISDEERRHAAYCLRKTCSGRHEIPIVDVLDELGAYYDDIGDWHMIECESVLNIADLVDRPTCRYEMRGRRATPYVCDECGCERSEPPRYCPNCGAEVIRDAV